MKVYKGIGDNVRPLRLFVGGVHGKECRTTKPILEKLIRMPTPKRGSAFVVPCLYTGRYVSTLDPGYLDSKAGKRLTRLLTRFKPDIYVEVHCYRRSSYESLTSLERFRLKGVPPLVELENGVLMGSVSPVIRRRFALKAPILIEVPCGGLEGFNTALLVLRDFLYADSVWDALKSLKLKYPSQVVRFLNLHWKRLAEETV